MKCTAPRHRSIRDGRSGSLEKTGELPGNEGDFFAEGGLLLLGVVKDTESNFPLQGKGHDMPVTFHADRFSVINTCQSDERLHMLMHALGLAKEVLSLGAAVPRGGDRFPTHEAYGSGYARLGSGEPDDSVCIEFLLLTPQQHTEQHLLVLILMAGHTAEVCPWDRHFGLRLR